jgi:hypothetical protein
MGVKHPISLAPVTTRVHAPGVHATPPGPVGTKPPVLRADSGNGSTATSSSVKALRILLVETGSNKLTDEIRGWVKKEIMSELKSVTGSSENHLVKKGFTLTWQKSLSDAEVAKLGPGDFVAYLVAKKSDAASVMKLAKRHVDLSRQQDEETTTQVIQQMNVEGGANMMQGSHEVSIVALERYELSLTRKDLPASVRKDYMPAVARKIAEIILHELGHGMKAQHGEGIMAEVQRGNMDGPAVHYSEQSRSEILQTLEAL